MASGSKRVIFAALIGNALISVTKIAPLPILAVQRCCLRVYIFDIRSWWGDFNL